MRAVQYRYIALAVDCRYCDMNTGISLRDANIQEARGAWRLQSACGRDSGPVWSLSLRPIVAHFVEYRTAVVLTRDATAT